jgi:hypothetical protein
MSTTFRVLAKNADTSDVFADLNADIADIKHYRAQGYTVTHMGDYWSNVALRDFVRQLRADTKINWVSA